MHLVQLSININFDESTQIHTPARKVFTALGGKAGKTRPWEPGSKGRINNLKAEIQWHYENCVIRLERTENHDKCINLALQFLETIDSVARIGNMQKIDVVTKWIIPAPKHNFASLNDLYMRTVMSQKEFMQGTYDSSVVLDIEIDDLILHHQSGPMMPEQLLKQFLVFKRENLPKVFIFLYTSISFTKVIQYSKKEMHSFLSDAMHKCEYHSESFGKIWEGYL